MFKNLFENEETAPVTPVVESSKSELKRMCKELTGYHASIIEEGLSNDEIIEEVAKYIANNPEAMEDLFQQY